MPFPVFLAIVLITVPSCNSRYAPDSEEMSTESKRKSDLDNALPSDDSIEDKLVDKGTEDEEEGADLPDGFELLDGVIVDTTNLMVQEVTPNATLYKMYETETEVNGQVMYTRSKREAGWHFILFEDPLDESGTGHLVLLQKLLGFTVKTNNRSFNPKEYRLYEVFHVDLGNDFTDENDQLKPDQSNESEGDRENLNNKDGSVPDPNDSAELVPSINDGIEISDKADRNTGNKLKAPGEDNTDAENILNEPDGDKAEEANEAATEKEASVEVEINTES